MKKLSIAVIGIVILGIAGILVAQQEYPNIPDVPVLLDNDKVVVQRVDFEVGEWSGEHSHDGNQLVVILSDTGTLYKEDGKERQEFFEAGDVFWRDKIVHDHKSIAAGSAILITVK